MRVLTARIAEHFCHKAHAGTHVVYLVLVCVESHGWYGVAAGGMAVVILVGHGFSAIIKRKEKGPNERGANVKDDRVP